MAENTIKNVKLKIGTENQFQSKLKELPINTLVGTTDPIQEGELDTSIINKLDKAENALPKPTNDTTGSAGQVLKKTASGSEWGDVESGTTVVANPTTAGTDTLTKLTVGTTTYTIPSGGSSYELPIATADTLGGVKSSTTGTTANRDYKVQVNADGTMKVNVPWVEGGGTTYSAGTHITIGSDNKINATWPTASDAGYAGIGKTGTITEIKMNGASKGTSGVVDLGTVLTADDLTAYAKLSGGNTFSGAQKFNDKVSFIANDGIYVSGPTQVKDLTITLGDIKYPVSEAVTYAYKLPSKSGTFALTSDIPTVSTIGRTGNLSDGTQDATHRLVTDTEKSTWNDKQDALSAGQISAINSGITSAKVTTYDGYATGKQDVLTATQLQAVNSGITAAKVQFYDDYNSEILTKYVKPATGIPKTDLASEVQTSLTKADSAVQPGSLAIKTAVLKGTTLTLTL